MPKEVKISFASTQEADGEHADISQILDGQRYDKEGDVYLRFEEEVEGAGTVKSTMRMRNGSVHITRSGGVKTAMDFKRGQDSMCLYTTPLGGLSFVISTEVLEVQIEEDRLQVDIVYDMYADGTLVSHNTLQMIAEEK